MELSELINPHYALPVVGVLFCALLVFAFGFKSPAQPPSFDFDEEKKTSGSKKKKPVKKASSSGQPITLPEVSVKDNTTEKSSKQSKEKQVISQKARQNKNSSTSTVQASTNKQQLIKSKKSEKNEKNALKKKEEKVIEEKEKQTIKKEETGEWVQHLTRKEKKNRKRDEGNGNGEEDDLKIDGSKGGTPEKKQPALIKVHDSNESSPSKKKKKKSAGNKENGEAIQLQENVKLENAKNEILLKEKQDKVDNFKNDVEKKIAEELKETSNIPSQPVQAREDTDIKSSAKAVLPEKVKAKESPVEASPKTKKSKKNKAKLEISAINVDQSIQAQPEPTIEVSKQESSPKDAKAAAVEVHVEDASKTQVEASGNAGGVAFDELQDVWQEPKVQKKKKKARKDQ